MPRRKQAKRMTMQDIRTILRLTHEQGQVQTCIVHLLRHSMSFASYNDRKAVYTAVDAEAAEAALTAFEDSDLARQYPELAAEACLYLSK